jgi:glycosyltransferase involved in cell wall biosynthesis
MPYRQYRNKGSEDGIKALGAVREKYSDIEFILYGENRPDGMPGWITFKENVSDSELRRLYSDADIFVCPSWVEGFGLTPMEASACGCAVVATNVGAVSDYAINGKTIISTPPRDPGALAGAIIRLVESEGDRKSIARCGNEYIKKFTWDKATDDLENIIKKHAGRK